MKINKRIIRKTGIILLCSTIIGYFLYRMEQYINKTDLIGFSISDNQQINHTPVEITRILRINKWEYLSIETEELIDSVKKGIFFDDRLVCIYKGRLSLGLNMQKLPENWIRITGADTLTLTLPCVTLLNDRFIDESKTDVFLETGSWKEREKEELYLRAEKKMIQRACSAENIQTAKEQAQRHFSQLLRTLGFRKFKIQFEKQK